MQLWRLKNLIAVCKAENQEAGITTQPESKGLRTRELMAWLSNAEGLRTPDWGSGTGVSPGVPRLENMGFWCPRAGEDGVLTPGERANWSFLGLFVLPGCSITYLDDARPDWQGRSSPLSPLTHMQTSSRNTLSDTVRNNVLPAVWVSLNLSRLTPQCSHHSVFYHSKRKKKLNG